MHTIRDQFGRVYAKIEDIRRGDILQAGASVMECILPGHRYEVFEEPDGRYYISCAEGKHYIVVPPGHQIIGFFFVPRTTLVDGSPVPEDASHRELQPSGMQKEYVVLSDAERAKGFVRPVRMSYRHLTCNGVTTMNRAIAETYARNPKFYTSTFCIRCGEHLPVGGLIGEFVWEGTDIKVGT